MVNAGHKVRVRMTAELDDGEKINLGLDDNDEAEFTMGLGEFPSYAESLVARMAVGETTAWTRLPCACSGRRRSVATSSTS